MIGIKRSLDVGVSKKYCPVEGLTGRQLLDSPCQDPIGVAERFQSHLEPLVPLEGALPPTSNRNTKPQTMIVRLCVLIMTEKFSRFLIRDLDI